MKRLPHADISTLELRRFLRFEARLPRHGGLHTVNSAIKALVRHLEEFLQGPQFSCDCLNSEG